MRRVGCFFPFARACTPPRPVGRVGRLRPSLVDEELLLVNEVSLESEDSLESESEDVSSTRERDLDFFPDLREEVFDLDVGLIPEFRVLPGGKCLSGLPGDAWASLSGSTGVCITGVP